jgi:hypothetical protein
MSKINQLQAAALNEPAKTATKTSTAKPATRQATQKSAVKVSTAKPTAKSPDAKTTIAKPAVAKPAAKIPTAPKVAPKKVEKTVKDSDKVTKDKSPKLKMERDSFTMPKTEYAQLYVLKERLIKLGQPSKKSELLRAGIMQLTAMTDAALKAALAKVPAIKTGRPKKK